jgi:hypothetical protein
MDKPINEMSKDELKVYAASGVDFSAIELDMRKSIDTLRADMQKVYDTTHPETTVAVEGELFTKNEQVPILATHIQNKANGRIFVKTDLLVKHLGVDGIVCDKHGNPA